MATGLAAMAYNVEGSVRGNGKALVGVTVSDGYNCSVTDNKGNFILDVNPDANYVSVYTPAGYLPPVDSLNHPIFYLPAVNDGRRYDFALSLNPRDDRRHAFMVEADVQVVAEEELGEFDRQIADARQHFDAMSDRDIFALDCGDIVGDHPELYQSSLRHRAAFGHPIYHVMGNHDMQYWGRSHETSRNRFEKNVGPSNYSFNRGNVHYIAVDNCFYFGRDYFYMGYIDERTFRWLEQDLANVPAGTTVVLFMHIPLADQAEKVPFTYNGKRIGEETVNAEHLKALLAPYPTHIITGHEHWNKNIEYSDSLYEHNTAAACGLWWQTPVCEDGSPRGYNVFTVNGQDFDWYYKSTGMDRDHQMRAYLPGELKDAPDDIVANVWGADSQWKIEWLEDGKVMGEMTQFKAVDPFTASLIADRSKLKYPWTSASPTPHIYRATPVNPEAKLTVRATDRQGRVFNAPALKAADYQGVYPIEYVARPNTPE